MKTVCFVGNSQPQKAATLSSGGLTPTAGGQIFTGSSWRALTNADGDGIITLSNKLIAGLPDTWRFYACGFGGASFHQYYAPPGVPTACWTAYSSDPRGGMYSQIAAGVTIPDHFVFWGGDQETGTYSSLYPARDNVFDAYRMLMAHFGKLYPLAKFWAVPLSVASYQTPTGCDVDSGIRDAGALPKAKLTPDYVDVSPDFSNLPHYTAAGYASICSRIADAIIAG